MPRKRPRGGASDVFRGAPFDGLDLAVILIGAGVVAALFGYNAFTSTRAAQAESVIQGEVATPDVGSSSTATASTTSKPVVDVIAAAGMFSTPVRSAFASATGADVTVIAGSGYSSSKTDFTAAAAAVDKDATLVVLIAPTGDASTGRIELAGRISEAVRAVGARAPHAEILLSGPVVSAAQGATFSPLRDTVHSVAVVTSKHWVDPVTKGWVGTQVDTTGAPSADGMLAAAKGLGSESKALLAG